MIRCTTRYLYSIVLLLMGLGSCGAQGLNDIDPKLRAVLQDSSLNRFTIEELDRYRSLYMREREQLKWERDELLRQGIRDAETFLSRNPQNEVGDKVMMRLAELYYEQAQTRFEERMRDYDRLYSLYERGERAEPPPEPERDYSRVLETYHTISEHYPDSDLIDDAFFNIGVLHEDAGRADSALIYYEQVLNSFPGTDLKPDVLMRLGEYYFNPPQNQVKTAISYYKQVLDFTASPRYDEALYRLGWSYYRLSQYDRAISYFTILVDDINTVNEYDPERNFTNPSLVDESVEYIGLSFLEKGGADAAVNYLRDIGGREYGHDVLKRIGDAYMREKEDYIEAISAYEHLLELYPFSPIAPSIQDDIVQCQRRLDEEALAYLSRDLLYRRYRKGSEWWDRNEERDTRERAEVLVESALRDNVTFLFSQAEENERADLYQQAVVESEKYLQEFPKDSNAALIHWNMALTLDTKLSDQEKAFNEYMQISDRYWNSKYQRYAARNAVALAREAAMQALEAARQQSQEQEPVTIDSLREDIEEGQGGFDFRDKMRLQPTPLHRTEDMLAQAYDNFIMLFPHDKDTPLFLANAGALYYHHNQFRNALKYFKTLLKHFPGSEQVNQARFAILESYFGKADFQSTEIIAKKILADSLASLPLQDRARRRLAEAIFLNAEMLAKAEQHFQAGNEYRRMVEEVPGSSFADLALFNAALEYDKANEFNRAIETYQTLLSTQPNSPYIYDAQNNMAFDYAELNDFRNAALVYKRLAIIHPDSTKARDALYNSSLYFAKAEDWENAVDVNSMFLERYPDDPEAEDLAFEIPKFYNQMNKVDRAFREYQEFIATYPNNRNVVEAHFRRGQYYRKRGDTREALDEYQQAVTKQIEFEEQGLEENIYFASESEYAMALIKFGIFESIEFRFPERELRESKERKKRLLLDVIRHLRNVTSFGTMRVYEATYLIGEAYREFAATWADQDIPEMERTRRIVAQKEVNDAARILYERAADAYRQSISATVRLSDGYRQSLAEEQNVPVDSLVISPQDSVIRIADTWLERSKTQLTRVNYQIADISLKTAYSVLEAPVPSRLEHFSALVYQKQVIDSVVTPLVGETLDIYKRNLVEADTFNIQSEWVELSKQKVLSTQNITAAEYAELAQEGVSIVRDRMDRYSEIVFSGRRFEDVLTRLQPLYDDMMNINTFNQKSVEASLDTYRRTVMLARNLQVEENYVDETKNLMMSTAYFFALRTDSTGIKAKQLANRAREAFLQDDTPLLEEGLFAFNSTYYALRDAERAILEEGYELASQLNIVNIYSQNLTLQLVRFDPESYASLLDLDIQTRDLVADTSWLASPDYYEGWTSRRFDESPWNLAIRASDLSEDNRPGIWTYTLENEKEIVERVEPDTTVTDTVIKRVRVPAQTAFFRKHFSVEGLPVACMAEFDATGIVTLYFNGDRITETAASSDSLHEYDLSDLLIDGRNVLSFKVVNSQEARYGLECRLRIKSLPHWDERVEMLRPELASEEMKKKLLIEQGRIP